VLSARLRPLAAVVLASLVLVTACGDGGSDSDTSDQGGGDAAPNTEPFTLRVGFIGTKPEWGGPEGYANSQGQLVEALKPLGVTKIESFQFGNGPDLNNALAGGDLDVGLYGDTPAINGRAAGQETRAINQARIDLEAFLFTPKDGATSLDDLEGGTIGVPQGSYMHRFVLGLLEEEGLEDSVTVTNLLIPDAAAALESGDIDAFAAPWTQVPLFEAAGYPVLTQTFPDYPDLAGSSVTVFTESLLDERPGLAEAWNEARFDSLEAIAADPEPYYDAQQPILGVDREFVPELENELENYPTEPFTDHGLDLLEGTKTFLVDIGAAKSDFEIADWQYVGDASQAN
jgi:sulfonate transport system substrate-binding protein